MSFSCPSRLISVISLHIKRDSHKMVANEQDLDISISAFQPQSRDCIPFSNKYLGSCKSKIGGRSQRQPEGSLFIGF